MVEMIEKNLADKIDNLLSRMTDMSSLAEIPTTEKSGTFSSYDRHSKYDEVTDSYLDWGANEDGDGCIRLEGEEAVVVELEGPGVIWRVWSAQPDQGNINFYFDGEEVPSYQRPFKQFFEQITEDVSPAGFPSVMPKLSGGYNSFFPIPFKKSLKITFSKDWGKYYHFTYTTFGNQEVVPSFAEMTSREGLIALAELDRNLYARGDQWNIRFPQTEHTIISGRNILLDVETSGAVSYLGMDINHEMYSDDELKQLLRSSILNIYWDQQTIPAVSVPLGDFFGTAPGYHLVKTLGTGVTERRMYANWYMPFSTGAKIELINESEQPFELILHYNLETLTVTEANQKLRFHAKWHTGDFQDLDRTRFEETGDRWPDWPLLLVKGAGRFCGMHLHVYDRWQKPVEDSEKWWFGQGDDKTIDWWWGEGDEKFFVDGEHFPSTFGTGSEDYIGYAWAAEPPFALFDSAYAAQSVMPVDGNGHTSVLRLQICDNVPFTSSFEAFIEKYKAENWGNGNINIHEFTPYWYQESACTDYYPQPSQQRLNHSLLLERERDIL